MGETYQYQPLPPTSAEGYTPPFTRILYLEAGSSDDEPFTGHLELIDVENPPPFEALSYTWGTNEPANYIWLGGCPLPIKPNLEGALRALRLPNQVRRLWVDALCIDQSNLDERARQVQYMRLVYKNCTRVVAWLGFKSPGVEEAFAAAQRIVEIRKMLNQEAPQSQSSSGRGTAVYQPFQNDTLFEIVRDSIADLPQSSMQNLVQLFDREYFGRSWVVQEIAVSPWATAKIEDLEMPFFDLASTLLFMAHMRGTLVTATSLDVWYQIWSRREGSSLMRSTDVEGSLGPIVDLLENMRSFKATDPRDKIFSIIGLCDEGVQPFLLKTHLTRATDRRIDGLLRGLSRLQDTITGPQPTVEKELPAPLKPDYKKNVVTLYTDLAAFSIRKSPFLLDILSYVQHHSDPDVGDEYPSWVPKWFEPRAYYVLRGGNFSAGICTPPLSDILQSRIQRALARPRILSLDGFYVGTVHQVSDIMNFGETTDTNTVLLRTWSQLFSFPMVPRPGHVYRTGEQLDAAFCAALAAAPSGAMYGSLFANLESVLGLRFRTANFRREELEQLSQRGIANFLADLSKGSAITAPQFAPGDNDASATVTFRGGVRICCQGRRAFLTREGHIGIGPTVMKPGDEVVVLFRGRTPYVLRRRHDHHAFMGDCYIRDDDIMYGRVTYNVRHGKGGPPAFIYELR